LGVFVLVIKIFGVSKLFDSIGERIDGCGIFISNFKVLRKQSFSICFPPANCFMQISFHMFCKVCTTNMNIFFAWYLHVIYLYYKYIDTCILRASPFHVYHTIETHNTSVCKMNMKIIFQTIKWNLHSLCVIFLLTSITCCIDIILFCTNVMRL
jgi:hypothetical protein